MSGLTSPPAPLNVRELTVTGAASVQAARMYTSGQPAIKRDSLIVFFHGGGFVGGDLDEADELLRNLVLCNPEQIVLATNYTLATERPFPAAVEDAHAMLVWAKKNKAKLNWSGKQLIVAGIEAGANLAAVSALMARDRGGPALAGQILIMPMLDPGLSTCSMRDMPSCSDQAEVASACAAAYRSYLPNATDRTHPYASPLQSSRLKHLPPTLILSSAEDPLRDEAEQYGAKLTRCGVAASVLRMPAAPLAEPGARNECACKVHALAEIAGFLATLDRQQRADAAPAITTDA
jgi:acetyl esterase